MNLLSFSLILTGVLLNAAAQLLLKAGTNAVGHFEFSRDNILPVGWQLATEPHIFGGLSFYVDQRGGVDHGAVPGRSQHRLPDAVHRLRGQRPGRLVAVRRGGFA